MTDRRTITSLNPATEEVLASYEAWSPSQISDAIDGVRDAQLRWRALDVHQRAEPMCRAAAILRERSDRYARLITKEMGKPLVEAHAELTKSAFACEHYAEHAAEYLADRPVATESIESYVSYARLGVVLAVMPWNFPFWPCAARAASSARRRH